jgi:hypothetical protein
MPEQDVALLQHNNRVAASGSGGHADRNDRTAIRVRQALKWVLAMITSPPNLPRENAPQGLSGRYGTNTVSMF